VERGGRKCNASQCMGRRRARGRAGRKEEGAGWEDAFGRNDGGGQGEWWRGAGWCGEESEGEVGETAQ
jgi:hypothetical protein